ncbi:MAG: ABC transporter permease [Candidatus Nezhaarchaeota archaeon]|nr:ABC transporter permease [Candidatus Nezhaarchaeota archaeon]
MMNPKRVWVVAERDVRSLLRQKSMLAMRVAWFAAQVAFFGLIANYMFREDVLAAMGGSYLEYYVAGMVVTMLYSTAIFIGYDVYEEADHGVVEYLLSLPVSRRELVVGRSIGSGVRSLLHVGPMIVIALYLTGTPSALQLSTSLFCLFLFAFGASGLSITVAAALKSSDRFDILMGVVDALAVRLSTALYPVAFMPSYYGGLASINPITFAADLFRWGAGLESALLTPPLLAVVGIVAFSSTFTFLGVALYERRLEGGGWR